MSNGSDSFDVTDLSGALNNETRAGLVNALKEGKVAPKDRLCIEILEQAERRDPLLGEASLYYAMAGDDLRMKLLYLENRVGLAKLLLPMEAKVVMDIAQVDGTYGTSEFSLDDIRPKNLIGPERTAVDWNWNGPPSRIQEKYLSRISALSRTGNDQSSHMQTQACMLLMVSESRGFWLPKFKWLV
uniref:Uncharacterized protein MANES_16G100600 n=2 Tax=Rhizophora mucronata TaxID=61149 RepID=A0A2P2M069_RHIMU